MKIAFLVERPTQFEAPFYRFAAADPQHQLQVLFTAAGAPDAPVYDPELGRQVSWGFDLTGGYPHASYPPRRRRRWLDRQLAGCDLLITNGYTQRFYRQAARRARRLGLATGLRIDTVRFAPPGLRQRLRRWVVAVLLSRLYDLFFAAGSLTRDYLLECGIAAERIHYFPYAVDVEHFRRAARLGPDERRAERRRHGVGDDGATVVLSVSKLSPREAPWDLLRAFGRLPADAGMSLLVAGDGPQRGELEAYAQRRQLPAVRFLGYVPYTELPRLYGVADLFVHPVQEERWGVSVAEALASGLPVLASSRVGAAHDLLAPGVNGFTYPAGDAEALARRLLESRDLDRRAAAAASRETLARWDYAATWRSLLAAAAGGRKEAA